jgi:2-methylcitrate dehydratase PrpD
MTLARELAQRACALKYDDLPPAAVHWAKVGLLDYIGVTLAGSTEPAARLALQALGHPGQGSSTVFGTALRLNALDAAIVNGTASHALDFDDCNNTFGGHPSAPILPALFALADDTGATGKDFMVAYVTGFEVETKIALGVHFHHYTKGWHPTATLGTFGAAAASARLMALDEERTATALAIAASLSSGIKANFGTMVKPLHVGHSSRNGLYAAQLARAGFTANADTAFEHKQGFLNVFNGEGTYDAARMIARWADPLDIVEPGIAIKQYPCCGSTHSALDAVLMITRDHAFEADDVECILVWTHPRRLEHTNRPAPRSDLDAKFSVQYCLARAVTDRRITIEHFEGETYRDPAVQKLLTRVHAATYGTDRFPAENHFGAEVQVHLKSGAKYGRKVDQPYGRTSANPLPKSLLKEKYDNCAARVLDASASAGIYAAVERFETLQDVRSITALTGKDSPSAQRSVRAV